MQVVHEGLELRAHLRRRDELKASSASAATKERYYSKRGQFPREPGAVHPPPRGGPPDGLVSTASEEPPTTPRPPLPRRVGGGAASAAAAAAASAASAAAAAASSPQEHNAGAALQGLREAEGQEVRGRHSFVKDY